MSAIELAPGADSNAFASMMATLVRQNLDDHPDRGWALKLPRGRVSVEVLDLGMSITFVFDGERLVIHDGVKGIPDVRVRGTAELITISSNMESLPGIGLPDPRGETNKKLAKALRDGELELVGVLRNPLAFLCFGLILAV